MGNLKMYITEEEKEKARKQLRELGLELQERNYYSNKLVEYLNFAGLVDIAIIVDQFRFAFQISKRDYINKVIDLYNDSTTITRKTQISKEEYKETKKMVIKLSKKATHRAKKYKDLYKLYLDAEKIVRDIEGKGIHKLDRFELISTLENYFSQPTGKYYYRDNGYYNLKESENLGYQYLAFYRDYESKYNEDVRKNRI